MTLLLADTRLPSGAHVHSGGVEQAVDDGVIRNVTTMEDYLEGRLLTSGRLFAHVAARACVLAGSRERSADVAHWIAMDDEVSARVVSPATRRSVRTQGRSLLKTALALYNFGEIETILRSIPDGPYLPVVQGVLTCFGGLAPRDAALQSAYGSIASTASAALRLLGLDPMSVAIVLRDMSPAIDAVAMEAGLASTKEVELLPSPASPLSDHMAERHAIREERLFAS